MLCGGADFNLLKIEGRLDLGRRDLAEVLRLLVRSLSIGVGIGVLFFVLQKWLIGCAIAIICDDVMFTPSLASLSVFRYSVCAC